MLTVRGGRGGCGVDGATGELWQVMCGVWCW